MADLASQHRNHRHTTAERLNQMPDHPGHHQSFVRQDMDLAPRIPERHMVLDFRAHRLDGRLHPVKVTTAGLITAAEIRMVGTFLHLH
jgi:uncharacterized protein Usg